MLCRFEFTAFLLCRLSPEFVAVLSFSGRWDECGMYGGRGFRRVTSRKPRFLLQIVEAPPWFICLHWSPGGDTFVFMLRIQQTLFHFTSYGCHIKPSLFHTSCNQNNKLATFLPTNHMVDVSYSLCRKSKKYFWHHNCKCSLLCFSDISVNKLSSVMNGALIVFSMRGKTKKYFSSFSLLWTESSNQQKI